MDLQANNHHDVSDTGTQCMNKEERNRGILGHLRQIGYGEEVGHGKRKSQVKQLKSQ